MNDDEKWFHREFKDINHMSILLIDNIETISFFISLILFIIDFRIRIYYWFTFSSFIAIIMEWGRLPFFLKPCFPLLRFDIPKIIFHFEKRIQLRPFYYFPITVIYLFALFLYKIIAAQALYGLLSQHAIFLWRFIIRYD